MGDSDQKTIQHYMTLVPVVKNKLGKTCFKDIGCFSGQVFDHYLKGVPHLPLNPKDILPEFRIYTKKNKKKSKILRYNPNLQDFNGTKFNPGYRTIVITHGFLSHFEPWMIALKDHILGQIYNKYNVVLVSWGKGSIGKAYFLAVANTRVMGALIAFFINRLCELFDMRNNMFHLIGHSLGAHIVGFAGKRLFNPKVDLITALDPAKPGFDMGLPSLENTDAKRVIVIHTDVGAYYRKITDIKLTEGLGSERLLGDVDFFPNGGKLQPGCAHSEGIIGMLKAISKDQAISCSHQRSYDLATSLGEPGQFCLPVGYQCSDWETFLEGRCADCGKGNSKCYLMGLYPWYWRGIHFSEEEKQMKREQYFLNTGALKDYCVYHYQIALHISNDSSISSGYLRINIDCTVNKVLRDLTIERRISRTQPGHIHTLLLTTRFMVESIRSFTINWIIDQNIEEQQNDEQNEENVLKVEFIEFNFMSHIYKKARNDKSAIFCPFNEDNVPVDGDQEPMNFVKCKDKEKPKRLATKLDSDLLHPITNYKDILSVDYDLIDIIAHKVIKSNLI